MTPATRTTGIPGPAPRSLDPWLFPAFALVWAGFFAMSEAASSIHQDMSEAYVWGQEFRLGYNQHPPFWAWICGAWFEIMPRAGWSFAILAAVNAAFGLWGSWRLIGRFAKGETRVAATALLVLTPFYTFFAQKYNANSIFLPLWPWTLYFFDRSFEKQRTSDAVAFGVFVAASLMSKYFALVLCATCVIAALLHPMRERYFRSSAPYVSVATALVLCAPHVVWLLVSGAPPIRYLAMVSGLGVGAALNNMQMTFFGALAAHALVLALVLYVARPRWSEAKTALTSQWRDPRFRTLTIMALAPLFLSLAAALVMQVKLATVMLTGVFSLTPLLAILATGVRDSDRLAKLALSLAIALSLGALILSPLVAIEKAWTSNNPKEIEPRKELALAATKFWRETIPGELAYVAGTPYYDDMVAFYSGERPHSFGDFDYYRHPWVTPEKIARSGLLSVCVAGDARCLTATQSFMTPEAKRTEMTLSHGFLGHEAPAVKFIVTAIPPRN